MEKKYFLYESTETWLLPAILLYPRTNNLLTRWQLESNNSLMHFTSLTAAVSTALLGVTLYSFQ